MSNSFNLVSEGIAHKIELFKNEYFNATAVADLVNKDVEDWLLNDGDAIIKNVIGASMVIFYEEKKMSNFYIPLHFAQDFLKWCDPDFAYQFQIYKLQQMVVSLQKDKVDLSKKYNSKIQQLGNQLISLQKTLRYYI